MRILARSSALAFVWALSAACGSSLPPPEFERFDLQRTPSPEDYPVVPGVVLLDRGTLTFTADPERGMPLARLRRYRRVKILRESGASLARIEVRVDAGAALGGFIARTVTPDGRSIEADTENATSSTDDTGERVRVIELPEAVPGAILEYTYDLYRDDLRFIPPWLFRSDLPTMRSELAVVVPSGFEVHLRFSENGAFVERPPERFETEEGTRFSWSIADVPALFPEPGMPSPELLSPRGHVIFVSAKIRGREISGFGAWDDVAAWFRSRRPNWRELAEKTRAETERVAGDAPRDERALKILEVIARDLKDEPHARAPLWRARLPHPETVLAEKQANPSSRGLLLVALLNAAGIPAVPALYAERTRDVLLPDLPTVRSLDGVAALIPRPEGALVLSPSELVASTLVPPLAVQGTRVVVLYGEDTRVEIVPVSNPEHSLTEVEYALALDPATHEIAGSATARFTGGEAALLRRRLMESTPDRYADVASDFLRSRGAALPIESLTLADLDVLRRPLSFRASVRTAGTSRVGPETLALPMERIAGAIDGPVREVRRTPLVLGFPRTSLVRATLVLPEGHTAEALPPPVSAAWSKGEVDVEVRGEGRNRVMLVRRETAHALEVPPSSYPEYRRFLLTLEEAGKAPVVIRAPASRSPEY